MVLVYKSRGMPIDMVDMRVLIIINIKLHMFKCFYIIQTIDKLAKWNNNMKDIWLSKSFHIGSFVQGLWDT